MRYFILDVFTDQIFKGNPLAVVLDADDLSGEAMQSLAREFNLSETTFVLRPTSPAAERRIRIFTPALELPLAGHPVIGTWHLLASEKLVATSEGWNTFHQELLAGVLPVRVHIENERVSQVEMTQARPQYFEEIETAALTHALSLSPDDTNSLLRPQFVSTGVKQLMLPLKHRDALRRIQPLVSELAPILAARNSHLVYAFAEENGKVFCRGFFCQGSLLFEDAATGSAAGALGAYLWRHGKGQSFVIHQGIEMGRDATIHVNISADGMTVKVAGTAVIVAQGSIGVENL